jgi:uncharacterized circularly permuted ATP-grasp superfamily protein
VESDAAAADLGRLLDAFASAGVTFDGAPMRTFLRPHLVARRDWDALRDAAAGLMGVAQRVARHAFGGDTSALLAFLGTPAAEVPWVALDPGPPDVVLSRLDAFLTPDGPRFIEINSDAPAGFGYGDRMAEVFTTLPSFRAFARVRPVRYIPSGPHLVEAVAGAWRDRGGAGTPTVAIVDWEDVKTRADQEILRAAFEAAGLPAFLVDPRAMEAAGGRLRGAGRPADVVYRRVLLQELVAAGPEVRPLLEAYRDRRAVFVNSCRCRLSEDKAFFALLSDERFEALLRPEERALVARVVPWTRKVEERRTRRGGRDVDLVPHVLEAREELVLKPAHGYGGQSVSVGDETSPADWEAAVAAAIGGAWVVQERVRIPEEPFPVVEGGRLSFEPLKVNVNPFYVRGAEVGAVTRASRSSVINVSAGGGSVPTFVVD